MEHLIESLLPTQQEPSIQECYSCGKEGTNFEYDYWIPEQETGYVSERYTCPDCLEEYE